MPSKITQRIERELQLPGLVDALATRLPPSDLRSLLMEAYRERASTIQPPATLAHTDRDPLMTPSAVDARSLMAFDLAAFAAARGFDAVDLSPVCPLGASFSLGGTNQDHLLTTIRNAEVLGDSTIAMALEAARRRRSGELVRLCASHRVIRLQPFDVPGFSPHFRLFGMVTAGRDRGSMLFETDQLVEHTGVYLRLFRSLASAGLTLRNPLVEFTDMSALEAELARAGITQEEVRDRIRAHRLGESERFLSERGIALPVDAAHPLLEARVLTPLRAEFPEAAVRVNQARLEGLGYYRGFALRISPEAPDGNRYPVADGGFTDWTARLMANRKERLLISGIGSEFVCKKYRAE
ncbi:hypothetical protein [uncultured Paludibaculum sp.]|uniref:hypothetical protein n=1 Tax=uncultured Paludibaculum sp. TaxID=1765020 RepID=UPI002AAAD369|nr:hypothetical protein [uncultured Paludibaculum sp.]